MAIAKQSEKYIKNYFEKLSQCGKKMSSTEIAKQAEEYVKSYFQNIQKIKLDKRSKGESGFDLRDGSSKHFVEVKGSAKAFKHLQGWYFTKKEYEKAQSCQEGTEYEIHLVVGIGSESPEHYIGLGKLLIDQATKEVSWWLKQKDFHNYDC